MSSTFKPTANLACLQNTRRFQTNPSDLMQDKSQVEQFRARLATAHHTQQINWRSLKTQLKQLGQR